LANNREDVLARDILAPSCIVPHTEGLASVRHLTSHALTANFDLIAYMHAALRTSAAPQSNAHSFSFLCNVRRASCNCLAKALTDFEFGSTELPLLLA